MSIKIKTKLNAYYNSAVIAEKYNNRKKLLRLNKKIAELELLYWEKYKSSKRFLHDVESLPKIKNEVFLVDAIIKDSFNLVLNQDVYDSGFPLIKDKIESRWNVTVNKNVKVVNLMKRKHRALPLGALPSSKYLDTSNYFNITLDVPKPTVKPRQKRYITYTRRNKQGIISKKRYKVDAKEYHYLRGGLIKTVNRKLITRKGDIIYFTYNKHNSVVDYLESISDGTMYNEIIRTSVRCQHCNRRATLKQRDNSLGCTKCARVGYKLTHYKIRLFYINSFLRYELNELNGSVRKQIETENGFRTILQGTIKRR